MSNNVIVQNFPSKNDNLPKISTSTWKQFIFASLKPNFDFTELIKEVDQRVGWMPIENFKYRADLSKDYYIKANWALYCDNYLEGFHIPFIHEELNSDLDLFSLLLLLFL